MNTEALRRDYLLPGAIVLAGLILAVAIYVLRTNHAPLLNTASPDSIRPVTLTDHILGNPEAPVKIVEYADIDSAYSKQFQATMEQLMSEYAAGGKVAWVYRHFPLLDQHENAGAHAEAAECAGSVGGPDAFWRFIDAVQAAAPGESQFPKEGYPGIASSIGLSAEKFAGCLSAGTFTKKVQDDMQNALAAGATGAPYVVVLVDGQKTSAVNGAIPYDSMKKLIDDTIAKAP